MVGTPIAGYTVRKEVGEGGTSAVYLAEHPNHGTVALKVLREKLRQDKTAVARFIREAKYGARVRHPNVVETIEIGQSDNGLHFLAIEWAEGEILDRYAKQNAPLPRDEVATIAYFLLTRCLPYTAKAPREMFTQLLTMPPIPLKDAGGGEGELNFSQEINDVVMRALSRAPAGRYPTVVAFASAFAAAAAIPPEQPNMLNKFKGLLRRNR